MIDILCQFGVLLGVAAWLPAPAASKSWLGARFALAGYFVVIYLFVGNVALGLPLSVLTWAGLAIGLAALLAALLRPDRRPAIRDLAHPIFVLTALFLAVAASLGGIAYQPYLGDETASWLNLTKQIYLADHYHSDLMDYHLPSYTNGWPLLLAAASSVYASYNDAHAVPLQFFMHLGVLAFIYDIVCDWVSETRPNDEPTAILTAWMVVVVFLAGEITWRLLPTDLLIEQPMLYAYAACFLIAIVGQGRGVPTVRLCGYWGVVLCAGYLFKVSMLAIAPTIGLFVLAAVWRDIQTDARPGLLTALNIRRLCTAGVWAFAPLAIAMTIWLAASPGDLLGSSVGPVQVSNLALLLSADGWWVTLRMLEELRDYGLRYKLPLTVIAGIGVFYAAWAMRWRAALFGFFIFAAGTWAGLYLYYLFREPLVTRGYLESFPRFAILPIRLFHLIGFLALTYAAVRIVLARVGFIANSATLRLCLRGVIGIGLIWQVREVARATEDMTDRRHQNPANIQTLMRYKAHLGQIEREVARLGQDTPKLAIFDPRNDVAMTTALYYSLKTRSELAMNSYRSYKPIRVYSVEGLAAYDMLWPVGANEFEAARIADYLTDPACATGLKDRILLRVDGGRFSCLPEGP
jgi:hypothetical protein